MPVTRNPFITIVLEVRSSTYSVSDGVTEIDQNVGVTVKVTVRRNL